MKPDDIWNAASSPETWTFILRTSCEVRLRQIRKRNFQSEDAPTMRASACLRLFPKYVSLRARPAWQLYNQTRPIATHTHDHHASAISILPSNVDKSSADFKENAAQMGELTTRMRELHQRIENGGPAKARDKHIARGKMLPREYVVSALAATADRIHR